MQCSNCELWTKREVIYNPIGPVGKPKPKKKRKTFYPTGRCLNGVEFGRMFTAPTTNCNRGIPK